MKIKHLLIGLFAVAAAVACKQDEPVETPKLDVDKTAVSLAATAGEASFNVTSNQSWVATADADWVSLEPASGQASEKAVAVKVTAEDNETTEARKATVTVKAGELIKTVEVNQAAGTGEEPGPGPEPGPDAATYLLVGDAVGGWNFDNPVVLTLTEGYYVAKEVGVAGEKDMHFTKNSSWEGNVKGLHGRIAPNEIGEVGDNNISLTVGGAYDIYLTEALDKFYFMTPGKTPAEAVEHVEIATVWGICGAIDGNSWGASKDPVLAQEGEWFVAKGITFTELNFKVRGNNTWADDMKWGRAAEDQACELNKAIAVSTCTEYKAANEGAGDNPNVYIEAPAGTYDIYFSPEKKEVWVMTQGYKPGDETPEPEVTYTVTGTIKGTDADKKANYWKPSNEPGLMALEGDYYVAKNVEFDYDYRFNDDGSGEDFVKFKICETGTWNAYGQAEEAINKPNAEIAVHMGGADIYLDKSGVYDVYFDKTNGKVWVMEAGYKPGEEIVTLDGHQWIAEVDGVEFLFDFGLAEEGMLTIAKPTMDGSAYSVYMVGFYEIEATDKSVGTIYFTPYDWEWDEMGEEMNFIYANLTSSSVKIMADQVFGTLLPYDFSLVEYPYEILPPDGGGESPEGPIADGGYWFTNSGKVMAPMAEDVTSGVFPAKDLINYASTVKNTFTFTYDPDYTAYTIQDSYGRYLGQTDWESGNATLVTELPAGEDYAYYLWVVDDSYGDGTADVYNLSTYFGIGYFADSNEWRLSEDTYNDATLRPFLVPADNPVEEPVEPEGPKVVTVAEFLAATDNDIEYQVSGTISGIYKAYDSQYDNISLYITDGVEQMIVFRMKCEGLDPTEITVGDEITVKGTRTLYNGVAQMAAGCECVELVNKEPEIPETSSAFTSNIEWTLGNKAYSEKANVNGTENISVLKLGTSSVVGDATIVIPAGTTKVGFYGVAWNGKTGTLTASADLAGGKFYEQSFKSNTGAANSTPYTLIVSDTDYYEIDVKTLLGSASPVDITVTLSTVSGATRVILFGLNYYTE